MSSTDKNQDPTPTPTTITTATSSPSSTTKLRKIPPIPIQRSRSEPGEKSDDSRSSGDDIDEVHEEEDGDFGFGYYDYGEDESFKRNMCGDDDSSIILASTLGLNRIRTRSTPLPSPLRFSSSSRKPSNLGNVGGKLGNVANKEKLCSGIETCTSQCPNLKPIDQGAFIGKKVAWNQSKSQRVPSPLNTGLESPRFQAILRVTSGRKKKAPDVKSFSHELNSKGVRPFPLKKSRAFGHMEEVLVATRVKFDRLKEEVNSDLGVFAGDLVGILEKTSDSHPEWKESLEDLLVVAQRCAKMPACEFWVKCEGIVQNLDDRRQELPMGILKQAHTRLLFILTRCTRLVQFHKESGYDEDHILGLHQLSDLGVYPEHMYEFAQQDISGQLSGGQGMSEKQMKKSQGQEKSSLMMKQDQVGLILNNANVGAEVDTAKSFDSTTSSYRMSSWKRLPSAAGRNRKGHDTADTNSKNKAEQSQAKDETPRTETLETPSGHPPSSKTTKTSWPFWGDHQSVTYENSMICRICEVEIPVVHVEEHSRICTIADRCDLKGLTVNERLERVGETLDKILESWTPKSTPKSTDTPRESFDATRVSTSSTHEDIDDFSPKYRNHSRQCSDDVLDCVPDVDNAFLMEDPNVLNDVSCETHLNLTTPDLGPKASSGGSLTPRSPLLTPRTSQIELLLSEQRRITELENQQQIQKLLDIARSVANANDCDYSTLECMLEQLDELKYAIQDRKADALVVETFGRRLEKLLQEKYVHLCGQIEDEKVDSSNHMADEDSSVDDETVRSLRASPINPCGKDRTSIEDFEIIKPISRGAFGRVFLARKRATGDLFAIKVLKKADMIRKNAVESILAERNILISVRNPFVVRFFYSFTCRENLYLVMEYLNGGDLFSLLRNLGCLDEDMGRVYIAEVVLALEYLHSLNVIHRDLKPDNLLIGQDGHIKLTDFGLSKVGLINSTDDLSGPSLGSSGFLEDEPKEQTSLKREQRQKHSVVGTPDYLAPEILLGMGHGATADWWSVGVILFELLVGLPPFNAETPQQIFDNIMNRNIPWPKVPEEMSYEAYDLIDKLLTENPVQRLGATGASEVKQHSFFKDINWGTLARQKAMFIPSTEAHDTSYFMSRHIWNPEDEQVHGSSDFDDMTDTCSSGSVSNMQDEDGDECGSLTDFSAPTLTVKYSFSNFSYKNLSQLASINYDLVVKSAKESAQAPKPSVP
ncbi:probable serine/threonine protein kinase IRE isoform X2 [Durio zibethinus]|uniref:non-specific serine/threonine protein kinase n=1 Tax=Durio zibethinus TaxID=66656 RepID=A0A6P5YB46_DURZI|nr:probable serine/threonine protein kinase IRE isoform X2 [Durio zibethinus]